MFADIEHWIFNILVIFQIYDFKIQVIKKVMGVRIPNVFMYEFPKRILSSQSITLYIKQ